MPSNLTQNIRTVGVVGAGTMGNGIAQAFAQAGFAVQLQDVSALALERALKTIEQSLGKLVETGRCSGADRDAALGRLSSGTTLDAFAGCDYVVEAAAEHAETKRAIFATLDGLVRPDVILASNTSSISITLRS